MLTVNTISALLSMNPALSNEVYVAGYYNANDLGGGEFYYDSGSSATPNNGTIFQSSYTGSGRWFRVLDGSRVNARWFGAYGNNSNNDTAALQAAIDYCLSAGVGLYIPKGVYIVTAASSTLGCLYIRASGLLMEGDGNESEIKGANSSACGGLLVVEPYASTQTVNTIIRNLGFNGNKANQSGNWQAGGVIVVSESVYSTQCNTILEGLYCHDMYAYNPFNNEGAGISTISGGYPSLTNFYPQNILIKGCYCWNNAGWGIGTNSGSAITISDNFCWNNDTQGITLWNSQDCVVSGNISYNNGGRNINLEVCERITVSGNLLKDCGESALSMYNSIDISVVGNAIEFIGDNYLDSAIQIISQNGPTTGYKYRPCKNVTIAGNNISIATDAWAVRSLMTNSQPLNEFIIIENNLIVNTVGIKGIELHANNSRISNNTIVGGVYIDSTGGIIRIDGNHIEWNTAVSAFNLVTVTYCDNLIMSDNMLQAANYCDGAIVLTQAITNTLISENIMMGSFSTGGQHIRVDPPASFPTTRNNVSW